MAFCCDTVIGGPVNVSVAFSNGFRIKLTSEGSVTIKSKNWRINDRSEGRGHSYTRENSYIEGTFILEKANFEDGILGQTPLVTFNDFLTEYQLIIGQCGLTVNLETLCGDVYTMVAAAETGDGTIDVNEGTASFRFSSPKPIVTVSGIGSVVGGLAGAAGFQGAPPVF